MTSSHIPSGFHTVTPYLLVEGAPMLIEFLTAAFDAEVTGSLTRPDGSLMHAEVKIGDMMICGQFSSSSVSEKLGT